MFTLSPGPMLRRLSSLLLLLLSVFCGNSHAEQKRHTDRYDIHFSALPTTFLTPAIAHNYGIERSPYMGLINIMVQDLQQPNHPMVAVEINGIATNILDARFKLKFREIREGQSIYYLAECPYRDTEEIHFKLVIRHGEQLNTNLNFSQKFFND